MNAHHLEVEARRIGRELHEEEGVGYQYLVSAARAMIQDGKDFTPADVRGEAKRRYNMTLDACCSGMARFVTDDEELRVTAAEIIRPYLERNEEPPPNEEILVRAEQLQGVA